MRTFPGGSTRDDDKDKIDYDGFLSPLVLRRYAEYLHKHRLQADGKMRDSDNWQQGTGIPLSAYMKSLWRHFMDMWSFHRTQETIGAVDREDAICAVLFNAMGYLHEIVKQQISSPVTGTVVARTCGKDCSKYGHRCTYDRPEDAVDERCFVAKRSKL